MREILFRAKRLDTGEWVEGYLAGYGLICPGEPEDVSHATGEYYNQIPYVGFVEINPATVGQFTGLLDKNGKRIFEGDVVRQTFEKTNVIVSSDWGGDEYGEVYGEDTGVVVIIPSKGACIKNPVIHREVNGEITQHNERAKMYKNICSGRCEVIGNIHDNPEPLEVNEDD